MQTVVLIEVICSFCGLFILWHGHVPFSRWRVVEGWPAYLVGIILTAVAPVAIVYGFRKGIDNIKAGAVEPLNRFVGVDAHIYVLVAAGGAALLICLLFSESIDGPPTTTKRRSNYSEDDYDQPRRKKVDYNRWRKPKPLDDPDDDRPRARNVDDD
jgi:hypothetical protein